MVEVKGVVGDGQTDGDRGPSIKTSGPTTKTIQVKSTILFLPCTFPVSCWRRRSRDDTG
uniref:Uncharacterized protein n=1 Tax=Setaria italica TaxID=4555 RepID=K3ZKX1_SETIT